MRCQSYLLFFTLLIISFFNSSEILSSASISRIQVLLHFSNPKFLLLTSIYHDPEKIFCDEKRCFAFENDFPLFYDDDYDLSGFLDCKYDLGPAADLNKLAMINIDNIMREKNFLSKMILQIHDELLFEGPAKEMDELSKIVVEEMEGAMKLSIPLKVDWKIGKNWNEVH